MLWSFEYTSKSVHNLKSLLGINTIVHGKCDTSNDNAVVSILSSIVNVKTLSWKNTSYEACAEKKVSFELMTRSSPLHIEMYLKDFGNHQRYFIKHVIVNIVQTMTLDNDIKFKTVVLYNIECLTKQTQAILKHIIEYYWRTARFILVTSSLANVRNDIQGFCNIVFISPEDSTDIRNFFENQNV